jgi:hypothetical protein
VGFKNFLSYLKPFCAVLEAFGCLLLCIDQWPDGVKNDQHVVMVFLIVHLMLFDCFQQFKGIIFNFGFEI